MKITQTALITGASSGIGYQLAHLFAQKGISIVVIARRLDRLESLCTELRQKYDINAHALALDLSQSESVSKIQDFLMQNKITIQYLVNNAGFGHVQNFCDSVFLKQSDQIKLNCLALVSLTHALLPSMKQNGFGRILNIGSTAGFQPGPGMAVYYASKSFVNSFSLALWQELRGTGISVTLSCPGPTSTEFGLIAGNSESYLFKLGAASSARVAKQAFSAMIWGKRKVVHGWTNWIGTQLIPFFPERIVLFLVRLLNQSKI